MAPSFVPSSIAATPGGVDVIVLGQKNGNLYALSAEDGQTLWAVFTSPGSFTGGLSWGVAVDDGRVYFTAINFDGVTWQMKPSNQTISNSAYGAASLLDGNLLWETQSSRNSITFTPPSVAGDIVIAGRTGVSHGMRNDYDYTTGGLIVLAKSTGTVIADIDLDANFHGGIAIQDEYIMFGTGYAFYNGTGSFYVMSVGK
jgi:outer membrane protein assembly factor BamB